MVTALKIAETLGGRSAPKKRLADYTAVIHRARSGLPFASLTIIGTRYGIPVLTLARVIGLPARTLARRKKERRLRADESDRLLRLARVAAVAEDVLGPQVHAAFSGIAVRQFDDSDPLRPEEQDQRYDPQPDRHPPVGRNGRNHIQVEDCHHEQ